MPLKRGTPAAEMFLAEMLLPGLFRYDESIIPRAQTINSTGLFLEIKEDPMLKKSLKM
jgi:hypothetical protein